MSSLGQNQFDSYRIRISFSNVRLGSGHVILSAQSFLGLAKIYPIQLFKFVRPRENCIYGHEFSSEIQTLT